MLGDEPTAGGTVRFVDSSVERLQLKVKGLTEDRFVLACNGRRVPLRKTRVGVGMVNAVISRRAARACMG